MEKTDAGTTVGVADPYAYVERCDHCTDDGHCRVALKHAEGETLSPIPDGSIEQSDPEDSFFQQLRERESRCPVAGEPDEEGLTGPWSWRDCQNMRARNRARECVRCGLEARRSALEDERPLLEEHHLSYADGPTERPAPSTDHGDGPAETVSHEITVYLCRWCHAKVHHSWAGLDDPVSPDPEALATLEGRRSRERTELAFESAAERRNHE